MFTFNTQILHNRLTIKVLPSLLWGNLRACDHSLNSSFDSWFSSVFSCHRFHAQKQTDTGNFSWLKSITLSIQSKLAKTKTCFRTYFYLSYEEYMLGMYFCCNRTTVALTSALFIAIWQITKWWMFLAFIVNFYFACTSYIITSFPYIQTKHELLSPP